MTKRNRNGNRKSNWTSKRRNMDARDANAPKIPIGSENFNAYYKAQGVVPEQEWEEFLAILVDPLPIAFRMNQFHSITPILVKTLKERFPALFAEAQVELEQLLVEQKARVSAANSAAAAGAEAGEDMIDDGRVAQPHTTLKVLGPNGEIRQERQLPSQISLPESLPWYPQEAGWHVSLARRDLRRVPQLKAFHEWLKLFTETGAISRQEVVSMIPPLLLGVKPHHMVLDMCAAPGSKTAQLLEALHGEHAKGGPAPSGMVVANDSNPRRSYMLSHRLRPHLSHALITLCNDARMLPNAFVSKGVGNLSPHVAAALLPEAQDGSEPDAVSRIQAALASADAHHAMMAELGKSDKGAAVASAGGKHGMFDRILCDAPCSGDGTLRKAAEVWKSWSPRNGAVLAPLQVAIARRGLRLLRPGGYMVYSTCTFNPIENEAVVAQLLRDNEGQVKLVDASALLPALKRRPGISTWKVFDSDMNEFTCHADAVAAGERAAKLKTARSAATHAKRRRKAADFDAGVARGDVQPDDEKPPAPKPLDEAEAAVQAAAAVEETAEGQLAALQAEGGLASLSAGKLQSFFWPPTAQEAAEMHLERCLRLLPHDANTGGFFVALLHKEVQAAPPAGQGAAAAAPAPADDTTAVAAAGAGAAATDEDDEDDVDLAAETPSAEDSAAIAAASAASGGADLKGLQEGSKRRRGGPDTTQVHFVPLPQEDFEGLRRAYGLRPEFPQRRLWCRTLSDRVVHYVSESSAALLSMPGAGDRFKFVNVGIPMFDTKLNRANRRQRLALDSADGEGGDAASATPATEGDEDATPTPTASEGDELDAEGYYPETRRIGGVRRVTNESAQYLLPFMTRRVIAVGLRVFTYLLRMGVGEFLPMSVLPAGLRAVVDNMGVGAMVVVCDPAKAAAGNAAAEADAKQGADATDKEGVWGTVHGLDPRSLDPTFTIVVWRNASTVNVLLRREDRDGHLLRLVLAGRVQPTAAERERFVLDTVMPHSAVGGPEPSASQNLPASEGGAADDAKDQTDAAGADE